MSSRRNQPDKSGGRGKSWINKENILFGAGLLLVAATFITSAEGKPFHYEFLILAAGMMGLSITSWADRKTDKAE